MFDIRIRSTTDLEIIKNWVERRGGFPAATKSATHISVPGVHFPGYADKGNLEEISWSQFCGLFQAQHLTFYYQERTPSGRISRLYNFKAQPKAGMALRTALNLTYKH